MSFALIGFGELGFELARGFRQAGQSVAVYSRPRSDPGAAGALAERLRTADVERSDSIAEALRGAHVVFAVVPAAAACEVVSASAASLEPGSLYADVAPLAPALKEQNSRVIGAAGALYVDAAVLGTTAADGYRVPILVSGPGAAALVEEVRPLGLDVTALEGAPGRATLVKLLRSVYMKGRDALILEMLVAATRHGVTDAVVESIKGSGERLAFRDLAERVMPAVAVHAARRADELGASAQVLRDADVEPLATEAGEERLRWLAELDVREHFRGERPRSSEEVLAAVEALSG